MSRKLTDLNNHLFAQIEKIGNEDLVKEELDLEINRSKAICSIAGNIINNANLLLKAERLKEDLGIEVPDMIQ